MFSIYLSSSSTWLDITGFLLQPARLPSASFRISHCYRYQWMPGKSYFFKKPNQTNLFLVSFSFSVDLYFVWSKILRQGWSGPCSVCLGVSHGQPSWCLLWWQPGVTFQLAGINSHWGAEISLYNYKYLEVFYAEGEIWTQGQSIKYMGDVAFKCFTSKKSRIQALKGCAEAQKVLQTQVFIRICSQG